MKPMSVAAWVFGVATVGLLAAAAYSAFGGPQGGPRPWSSPTPDPPFEVEAVRDLGVVPLGVVPVTFSITNPASRSRRVIGYIDGCKVNCIRAIQEDQITIPAGETFAYPCELTIRQPGTFEVEMRLLLEDNCVREVTLTVRGTAVSLD